MQTNWKSTSQIVNGDKSIQTPNESSQNNFNTEASEINNLKKKLEGLEKILSQVTFKNLLILMKLR